MTKVKSSSTNLKRFQVTIPGRLWLVLDSLSDLNGYDSTKSLVEQLICDYCCTAIKQLRDDVNSDFHQFWRYEFVQSLDDDFVNELCASKPPSLPAN